MLCNISFPFSFYGENIKRRLHLSSPIQVSSYLLLHDYGCSFVAELGKKLEKNFFFFWKNICVFTKYTFFAEKNVYIWKKKFYNEVFSLKKTFFNREKLYLISEIYFYTENTCITNKIWISFKYIFILQKKTFLIIKNIFVKTSLRTQ